MQWRSQREDWGVQTPSSEKGVYLYCLVIEQKQWLIIKIVATRCRILRLKCTKFRFRLELRPRQCWGAHSVPPDPKLHLRGPTSKGREGSGREKWERGEGKGGLEPPPLQISGYATA